MEPLGTITQYFPFLDEDTRNALQEIMDEVPNYFEFAVKLTDKVLNENCSDRIVYFAIHHAALAMDFKVIDQIREKYSDRLLLGPYLYFASAFQGNTDDLKKVHETADEILASKPEDWLVLEMNCMKFEADMRDYPRTIYGDSLIDTIREYIANEPRFGFYETTLNDYLSRRARIDGIVEERIRCIDRAIESATKFNDQVRLVDLLAKKSTLIEDVDRGLARDLLKQAYDMSELVGIPADFAFIIYKIGRLESIRGIFDAAIKHFLQSISIKERVGLNVANDSWELSTVYNMIGESESGLEWARMTEDQYKSRPLLKPHAILNQAWSLILLGQETEALILIDSIREEIMKSGRESLLAWLHFVTGVLEMHDGDYTSAASSIEEALRIYEMQRDVPLFQLICLYHLARIEATTSQVNEELSPSLAVLEEKALEEDLPGFLGLVHFLKGELALANNDDSTLRDSVQRLQPLSEMEGMKFLKPFLKCLLEKG
jgi:tetratricopeptide (TPR) repeat protein